MRVPSLLLAAPTLVCLALGVGPTARAVSPHWDFSPTALPGQPLALDWLLPFRAMQTATGAAPVAWEDHVEPILLITPAELTGTPGAPGSDSGCLALLAVEGLTFELAGAVEGIATPVRLTSTDIGGVRYRSYYLGPTPWVFDCRLALALIRAAPVLRANGVTEVIFASHYRPSWGTLRKGQYHFHAQGLAIDIKGFTVGSGVCLDVARDYEPGLGFMDAASCLGRPLTPKGLLLRKIACDLDEADVFESILTPDYDEVHWNHFHFSAFHPQQRSLVRPRGTALAEVPLDALPDWALGRRLQQQVEARHWDRVAARPFAPELDELQIALGIPPGKDASELAALLLAEPEDLSGILGLFAQALHRLGPAWLGVLGLGPLTEPG